MKPHPYLRAYMAGAMVPTVFVMFVVVIYTIIRYGMGAPFPIEKGIIFPVALVPNLFGIWNVVYAKIHQRHRILLGVHGALLPFIIAPIALTIAVSVGIVQFLPNALLCFQEIRVPYPALGVGFACALIIYYLVWKYLVGFLNEVVGVA